MLDLLETGGYELPENLLLIISLIGLVLLAFVAVHIISAVRAWKVQRAILEMQADVKEIKSFLQYSSSQVNDRSNINDLNQE